MTAFLCGVMKENVYCMISGGVDLNGDFDCPELVKAIYGLKQAFPVWNDAFDEYVRSIDFQVSAYDPCLFIKYVDGQCVLLLIYVGVVLVTGGSASLIARTKIELKQRFEIMAVASAHSFYVLSSLTTLMAVWRCASDATFDDSAFETASSLMKISGRELRSHLSCFLKMYDWHQNTRMCFTLEFGLVHNFIRRFAFNLWRRKSILT